MQLPTHGSLHGVGRRLSVLQVKEMAASGPPFRYSNSYSVIAHLDTSQRDEVITQTILFRLRQPLCFFPLLRIQFGKKGIAFDIGVDFRRNDLVDRAQGFTEQLLPANNANARGWAAGTYCLFQRTAHRCAFGLIVGIATDDDIEPARKGASE